MIFGAVVVSINRKKLADSVIEEIKGMIKRNELQPGDKLPNQNEFAAQLGGNLLTRPRPLRLGFQ